jgi:hypothetical protein
MSDIFSLNNCFLDSSCTPDQYKTAYTLLNADSQTSLTYAASSTAKDLIDSNTGTVSSSPTLAANTATVNAALAGLAALPKYNEMLAKSALDLANGNRSLQINTYYAKKHAAQNEVIKIVGIMGLIVFLLWLVGSYFVSIPSWIISAGMSLTIGVCSILIIFKSVDIANRNNFDYDQYDTKSNNLPPLDTATQAALKAGGQQYSPGNFGKHCQDNSCCPKFYSFSPSLGQCSFSLTS